jgi:PqqD family protein of HPr-rel-A system
LHIDVDSTHASFPQGVWTVSPALTWRQFDDSDDWLVYNERSAQVHLVSPSTYVLWDLLATAPTTFSADLVRMLAERLGRAPDSELADATVAMIHFMDGAGLILPVPG